MTLLSYIEKTTEAKIAAKLGINPFTVYAWKRGLQCPKPIHLSKLIQMSKGKLTHREVIETYVKGLKKPNKKSRKH